MNWKARSSEFRSGTRKVFPKIEISTSFSYGRKTSEIRGVPESATVAAPCCVNLPVYETKSLGRAGQRKDFGTCSMLQWQIYAACEPTRRGPRVLLGYGALLNFTKNLNHEGQK